MLVLQKLANGFTEAWKGAAEDPKLKATKCRRVLPVGLDLAFTVLGIGTGTGTANVAFSC